MRLAQPTGSRANYFDRNPINKTILYEADAVAPHAVTTRATYTVPAGKKALIESGVITIMRSVAAAPVGRTMAVAAHFPTAGSGAAVLWVMFIDNNVGVPHFMNVGQCGLLLPADFIAIATEDLSTGGAFSYRVEMKVFEFDG